MEQNQSIEDEELLQIFPEAREVVIELLKNKEKQADDLVALIQKELRIIESKCKPENQWFFEMWIQNDECLDLVRVEADIARLKRYLGLGTKKLFYQEQLDVALAVPMEAIAEKKGIKLRRTGKNLTCLCPFHPDKNPSCYIYPSTNTFHCFGCNENGNVISFVRLLYGFSFKGALEFLNN